MTNLFTSDLKVINVGLDAFADSIIQNGGNATKVAWRPPALGDTNTGRAHSGHSIISNVPTHLRNPALPSSLCPGPGQDFNRLDTPNQSH